MRLFLSRFACSFFLAAAPLWAQGQPAGPTTLEEGLRWTREVLQLNMGEQKFGQILASFLVLLVTLLLRKSVIVFVFRRLRAFTSRTKMRWDDRLFAGLEGPLSAFVLVMGLFFALTLLRLDPEIELFVLRAFQAAILVVVFWGFLRITDVVADAIFEIAREKQLGIFPFIPLLKKTVRVFFLIIGIILIIQNLGYSVGSLLAGLGIGGLAVALAAQDSLSNFFGSLVVAVDRPFKLGDFVKIGSSVEGVIEEVGLRSTKIRTRAKSLTVIPNKMMATEVIENFSEITKRRVEQTVGVTYETMPEQMESLLSALRDVLAGDEGIDRELQLVRFINFGASSLDIFIVFFTVTPSWADHFTVRERVNLKIMRAVAAEGLSIAFPTQTLYFEGEIARRLAEGGRAGQAE